MSDQTMNTQQPTNATPADIGGSGEKLFTQEEVNKIISERLARERSKQEPQTDPAAEALAQRERELTARENRLTCDAYIREQGLDAGLLDIFDTGDPERFKGQVEKLLSIYPAANPKTPKARFTAPLGVPVDTTPDPVAEAFRRK